MGNYSVMKCACCENRYSQIKVLRLSAKRSDEILRYLSDKLKEIGAKGAAHIVEVDDLIVGAIYEYADKHESTHSDVICHAIDRAFDDINDDVECICDPRYIEVI